VVVFRDWEGRRLGHGREREVDMSPLADWDLSTCQNGRLFNVTYSCEDEEEGKLRVQHALLPLKTPTTLKIRPRPNTTIKH